MKKDVWVWALYGEDGMGGFIVKKWGVEMEEVEICVGDVTGIFKYDQIYRNLSEIEEYIQKNIPGNWRFVFRRRAVVIPPLRRK